MSSTAISFHDSSLRAINPSGGDICLSFENVYVEGTLRFAEVKLRGVTEILRDGHAIGEFELLEDDGEVLDYAEDAAGLTLLISWVNFKQDTESTHSYRISCRSIDTTIGSISPDSPIGN
jgi:hypothetical protein